MALMRLVPIGMVVAFTAGCGSQVSTAAQAGSTTSGGGGAASSSSTGTGTGTGGAPTLVCPDKSVFFDLFVDGIEQTPSASSPPVGNIFGPPPPKPPVGHLVVSSGGESPGAGTIEIELDWPGMSGGLVRYWRDGSSWAGNNTLAVTSVGEVGGFIDGAYSADVVEDIGNTPPGQLKVHGKFRICRGPDGPGGK